jgi:hypothetical protein
MSQLVFDGTAHTLTLFASDGSQVGGPWAANNVVDRKATLRFVPNRTYSILDRTHPFKHGGSKDKKGVVEDSTNGAYGPYGIIRLRPFIVNKVLHQGVGIHSGRANKGAENHPTMGCIRTTDAAMLAISRTMGSDPLTTIVVKNNHDQHNTQPNQGGDQHSQSLKSGRSGQYALA